MKAVVTGAAGFIGSTLVDRLLEDGNEVVAMDNFCDSYSGKMRFLGSHVGKENFRLDEADILDLNSLRKSVEGADVVFHLAAQAGSGISDKDPTKAQMANATGTLNVLLAAKNAGVGRVVSASSSSVYGNVISLPVKETDPTVPVSPFAASKLAAEEYCRLFYDLYGLQSVSLRFFTVYGPRQHPDTDIGISTERALSGRSPQIYGDGNQTRDLTFISDVVDAISRCADCPDPKGRPLNLCSGRTVTANQVVKAILESAGRPDVRPEYLPDEKGDEDQTWGNNAMAKTLLSWEPKVPVEKGLVEFVEWYKRFRDPIK
jgi:UDP-glucose 4-epimerase